MTRFLKALFGTTRPVRARTSRTRLGVESLDRRDVPAVVFDADGWIQIFPDDANWSGLTILGTDGSDTIRVEDITLPDTFTRFGQTITWDRPAVRIEVNGRELEVFRSTVSGGPITVYCDEWYSRGGDDNVSYTGSLDMIVYAGRGKDTVRTGDGDDKIFDGVGFRPSQEVYTGPLGIPLSRYQDDGNDVFSGGAGNDTIWGGTGKDFISGGAGDDVLRGGYSTDPLYNGFGPDTQTDNVAEDVGDELRGDEGNDDLCDNVGSNTLRGGAGDDDLTTGAGSDRLFGDAGRDSLWGGAGNDKLEGGTDNDTLRGSDGDDELFGGSGDDDLFGGRGWDWLFGQDGNDFMDGGADTDFAFGGTGTDEDVNMSGDAGIWLWFGGYTSPISGTFAQWPGVQDPGAR